MEYFDWLSVPQVIVSYFGAYLGGDISTAASAAQFMRNYYLICILVAAGLYLLGLVMGGIGLNTIAKRRGVKNGWLGFLPFGNTYMSGKFADEGNIFGKKVKNIGLWCVIAEFVFVAIQIFTLVANVILVSNPNFYSSYELESGEIYYMFDSARVTSEYSRLVVASDVINVISYIWWFVLIFLFCTLYFAFFRKYYARSPFLMTFLCSIIPCRGFVLFAVRNNTPLDYNEYIRKRMAEERRRQEEQYGRGGDNGNGGSNGYGGTDGGGSSNGGNSPFPDFDGTSGSGRDNDGPFSDFKN